MQLTETIGLELPIFQAPLSLYPNQNALVSRASESGALGIYDCMGQSISSIDDALTQIEHDTDKPYAVMLSVYNPQSQIDLADLSTINGALNYAYEALGISNNASESSVLPDFDTILDTLLSHHPSVIIFQNGLPDDAVIERCQQKGLFTIAIAGNILESIAIGYSAIDAVLLQGVESAGLHSRFKNDLSTEFYPAQTLLYHALANVPKPLIVWGDMVSSANIVGQLINGASAVVVDTPFWTCNDAALPSSYRQSLALANEMTTVLTPLWNGFPSRVLKNNMWQQYAAAQPKQSLPMRNQQALLLPIIEAAIAHNHSDFLPMWSSYCPVVSELSIEQLCQQYLRELSEMIA